jgi:hypothetical protein
MNKLSTEERTRVVAALVEGSSLRSVTRMTGVHRTTVMKLLCDLGRACSEYQDKAFRNLKSKRIDQRVFKKGREFGARGCAALHALQLLPDSPDLAGNSRDGSWSFRSRLEFGRNSRFARLRL